jgi:hypothetical protein
MRQNAEMHQVAYALYSAELLLFALSLVLLYFVFVTLQIGFVFVYGCGRFISVVYGMVRYSIVESYASCG